MSRGNARPFPIPVRGAPSAPARTNAPWYAVPQQGVPGVVDVVLVASGKGGVGKSTVTVNLACALQAEGRRVGVLDADLYGPSVARMLGTGAGVELDVRGWAVPPARYGVASLSVANVLPPEAALVWKGPLVAQALTQMFYETAWPGLDILLVDLPPGTGDVQLTILEQVAVSGAVVVSTPQQLALVDAERGIALFHELDVPVFGVVENMDRYICPCCGAEQPLFPAAGVAGLARRRHVRYLGGIPLDPAAQAQADEGRPLFLAAPRCQAAQAFMRLAREVLAALERERRASACFEETSERAAHEEFWEGLLEE